MSDEPNGRAPRGFSYFSPLMIEAAIEGFFQSVLSRITGKPQFVISVTLRDERPGWAAKRKPGGVFTLASHKNATIFRSKFTAAAALSNISKSTRFRRGRVEQIR